MELKTSEQNMEKKNYKIEIFVEDLTQKEFDELHYKLSCKIDAYGGIMYYEKFRNFCPKCGERDFVFIKDSKKGQCLKCGSYLPFV
jgi:hypothetical protein